MEKKGGKVFYHFYPSIPFVGEAFAENSSLTSDYFLFFLRYFLWLSPLFSFIGQDSRRGDRKGGREMGEDRSPVQESNRRYRLGTVARAGCY